MSSNSVSCRMSQALPHAHTPNPHKASTTRHCMQLSLPSLAPPLLSVPDNISKRERVKGLHVVWHRHLDGILIRFQVVLGTVSCPPELQSKQSSIKMSTLLASLCCTTTTITTTVHHHCPARAAASQLTWQPSCLSVQSMLRQRSLRLHLTAL